MKVILVQDIKNVGKKDDIINASDGYARNYLFPRKLALEANNDNLKKLKEKKMSEEHKKNLEKQKAVEIAKQIESLTLKLEVKTGGNGKLFGAITAKDIAEKLEKDYKIVLDKKRIILEDTIKNVGIYSVTTKLYEGVAAQLKVVIEEGL